MKIPRVMFLVAGAVLVAAVALWGWRNSTRRVTAVSAPRRYVAIPPPWAGKGTPDSTRKTGPLTPAEKAAAIQKIRRDYDDLRAKAAAEYTTAGSAFPGGLNALLRQLALLETERRRDLLRVLTDAELEAMETQESHAGGIVRQWLDDTLATAEQKRAVFRLQRDFDDQFGLTFDLSPAYLLLRERERQSLQEKVRTVLGDDAFGAWLRQEGMDYGVAVDFVRRKGLPPSTALELWRLKNLYMVSRLELGATPGLSAEQVRAAQQELALTIEGTARTLLGPAAADPGMVDVLAWLPPRR